VRALLLLLLALVLLGTAFLVSRGVPDDSLGDESPAAEVAQPVDPDGLAPPPSASETLGRRVEAEGALSGGTAPPPAEPDPADEGAAASIESTLDVLMLTPTGEPLEEALEEWNRAHGLPYPKGVGLGAYVAREPPEVGASVTYEDRTREGSPFIESRSDHPVERPLGFVDRLTFQSLEPAVHVCAMANLRVLAVQHVRCDAGEVTFVLSTEDALVGHAGLRVCFVDEAGEPIEGVEIERFGRRRSSNEPCRSDLFGVLELGLLDASVYDFVTEREGYARARLRFSLGHGEQLDLGRVVLKEPIEIGGRLIGPGAEIREREVIVRGVPAAEGQADQSHEWYRLADTEGHFLLEGLEPGRYAVRAATFSRRIPGRGPPAPVSQLSPFVHVDATRSSVRDVQVELEPRRLVIINTHLSEGDDVDLRILDAAGLPVGGTLLCPDECALHAYVAAGYHRLVATRGEWSETIEFDAVAGIELDVGP